VETTYWGLYDQYSVSNVTWAIKRTRMW